MSNKKRSPFLRIWKAWCVITLELILSFRLVNLYLLYRFMCEMFYCISNMYIYNIYIYIYVYINVYIYIYKWWIDWKNEKKRGCICGCKYGYSNFYNRSCGCVTINFQIDIMLGKLKIIIIMFSISGSVQVNDMQTPLPLKKNRFHFSGPKRCAMFWN